MRLFGGRFLNRLERGELGIRAAFPRGFKILQRGPSEVYLADNLHQVMWGVSTQPFATDLDPENDERLREDIGRAARFDFENEYRRFKAQLEESALEGDPAPLALLHGPRTANPSWSPVVEVSRIEVNDRAALRVLRRAAYQPTHEVVVGHVIVPLPGSTLEFTAMAEDGFTGLRESLLFEIRARDTDPEEIELTRAEIDAPEKDDLVPQHCLSRVRRALAWLSDPDGGALSAAPSPPARDARTIELHELGIGFELPPRYVRAQTDSLNLDSGIALFTRTSLPTTPPWTLSFFLLSITHEEVGQSPDRMLERLARQAPLEWEEEGCTDIEVETTILEPGKASAQVESRIAYKLAIGQPTINIVRWLLFSGLGALQITSTGPPFSTSDELRKAADEVVGTLHPLSS